MTQAPTLPQIDWLDWLRRWDSQQARHMYDREGRFEIMLDAVEATVGGNIVALDLACGPGAISQRLLARFPEARSYAVDLDPLLLALGQGVLGDQGGRLTWIDDDLNDPAWANRLAAKLGERKLDAVLSTTALHWVSPGTLARVYREIGQLMRPGAVFLNGDHMAYSPERPTIAGAAARLKEQRRARIDEESAAEDWPRWWQNVAKEPAFADLHAERERRFGWRDNVWARAGLEFQVGALRDAGFREVDTIWQRLDNRVLMAVR